MLDCFAQIHTKAHIMFKINHGALYVSILNAIKSEDTPNSESPIPFSS
jgi:hypothetical protein